MKNKINLINYIYLALIIIFDLIYIFNDFVIIKAIASLCFVALGVTNLVYAKKNNINFKFSLILVIGLVFAFLGDVIIEYSFVFGALLFAIGHIFFFVSYTTLSKFKVSDLVYGGAIFLVALCVILFVPIFKFDGIMQYVCIVYALIISAMVGKSITNYLVNKDTKSVVILIGSILFFISDFMLLINKFSVHKVSFLGVSLFSILCLITYYPAEFMLAHSIIKGDKNNVNKK